MANEQVHDPLNFMRSMWGNMGFSLPGMVAPTFDLDELDKRIKDMKAVEGWLRMNLSMLQMTIQGLEMQRTTVSAVQAMGQMAADSVKGLGEQAAPEAAAVDPEKNAFSEAAMWPWQLMQQMREQMQQAAETAAENVNAVAAASAAAAEEAGEAKPRARRATAKK